MLADVASRADRWSSIGLNPVEAFQQWQSWACSTLASLDIEIPDSDGFSARWENHSVGPLQLVSLAASPERLVNVGRREGGDPDSVYQLVYCGSGSITTEVGSERFRLGPGDFTLLDTAQAFQMRMEAHEAIVLLMPGPWLERWLPSPARSLGRAYSASSRWGLPLGSLLSAAATGIDQAVLPRSVIADQLGSCLALAVGRQPAAATRHRGKLAQRLLRLIEERHADPGLDPGEIARALGISTRYLHALLAESGTTFSAALNKVRLTRACELLGDPRLDGLQVGEISWRCGYLDPSYFTRVFRQRFGACPREWRKLQRA